MNDNFAFLVLEIVNEIPKGKVATFKQIATMAGKERNARQIGKILSCAEYYGKYPCHRVVNSSGRLAPNFYEQRSLLEDENIIFLSNGNVDMKKHKM